MSILLTLIILSGCSNGAYKDAMDHGMRAVDDEQFKEALDHFEKALKEKPNDEKAKTAIEQIKIINNSLKKLKEEKTSEAISHLEKVIKQKNTAETIKNKTNEILLNVKDINKQLSKIDNLINKNKFEEALNLIKDVSNNNEASYLSSFKKQLTSLEKKAVKTKLFTHIEGHSSNIKNNLESCQVTELDIMCTITEVDVYSYEEIKSIKYETDDALNLELSDGSQLLISNITEDSYDMHNHTFEKTTAEEIVNRAQYYESIEEIFDRENFKDVLETGIGQHELFKYDEQTDEKNQVSFDGYSDEEIEYARVWLHYLNGQSPPQLTVTFSEKGDYISPYAEYDELVFPEDVTVLLGEHGADGRFTYSSNNDGTITVYDVPYRWHQQSEEEFKEAAEEVLQTITTKEIPAGNDTQVLNVLDNMIIDESVK